MSSLDLIEKGFCPNGCGELTWLKKPHAILYLIPEDLCEPLEGVDTPEDMFGFIKALCSECGFIASTPPTHEYDYELEGWFRISGGMQ